MIVAGPASFHEEVGKYIEELDVDPRRNVVERVYQPKHQTAGKLIGLLQNAVSGEPNTTLTLDPRGQPDHRGRPRTGAPANRAADRDL